MNTAVLDVLLLRRVRLEYISPPICQAILSGSGSSLMLEAAFGPDAPTELTFSGQCERFLTWTPAADTVCTSLYRAYNPNDPLTPYLLEAECLLPGYVSLCSDGWWCYSTLTADGTESDRSDPVLVVAGTRTAMKIEMPAGAVRFNLFRNPDPTDSGGTYTLVLSTVETGAFEVCDLTGLYKLQTISENGASELSAPVSHTTYEGCIPYVLHDILGDPNYGCTGIAYSTQFEAVGGAAPYLWELASGTLPPGLTLQPGPTTDEFTTIDGTPTTGGDYSFEIRCTDASGHTLTKPFSISTFGIVESGALPDAVTDSDYTYGLSYTGGTPAVTFAITGGALPSGFSLSASGTITADTKPSVPASSSFTVTATDADGRSCSTDLTLDIVGCPTDGLTYPSIARWEPATTGVPPAAYVPSRYHAVLDPIRRKMWLPATLWPATLYSTPPFASPYNVVSVVSTIGAAPSFTGYATDPSGLFNTQAKGDTDSGAGRIVYDTFHKQIVVNGNQGWTAFYDPDTEQLLALNKLDAGHPGYVYQFKQDIPAYDPTRGKIYLGQSGGALKLWVLDCNPAIRGITAEHAAGANTAGGKLAYCPDNDTVYIANVDGANLLHKWNPDTAAFTLNTGPAGVASSVLYWAGAKLLVLKTAGNLVFVDPNNGDSLVGSVAWGAGAAAIDWYTEDPCTGFLYLKSDVGGSDMVKVDPADPTGGSPATVVGASNATCFLFDAYSNRMHYVDKTTWEVITRAG